MFPLIAKHDNAIDHVPSDNEVVDHDTSNDKLGFRNMYKQTNFIISKVIHKHVDDDNDLTQSKPI